MLRRLVLISNNKSDVSTSNTWDSGQEKTDQILIYLEIRMHKKQKHEESSRPCETVIFPLPTFRLSYFNKHHTAVSSSLHPHSGVCLHDFLENTRQNSISGCAYELLPISSPGAALDQNLFIIFCKSFSYIDCLPLVSRRHLEQLHWRKNTKNHVVIKEDVNAHVRSTSTHLV